jgi:hypothetical protein
MIDGNIEDPDFDRREPVRDSYDPFFAPEGGERLGHGFVERRGGYLDRMSDALHIGDRDAA